MKRIVAVHERPDWADEFFEVDCDSDEGAKNVAFRLVMRRAPKNNQELCTHARVIANPRQVSLETATALLSQGFWHK